ncbi:beta-lactamase family protein [Ilyonectria robusta]|uniref:beta-lactamase family protein n=1 Tax=Ilyonectria robusta TaxID=1079257 RepID=UPI001E8CBF94|nr:beta-lactamase family protein [Ilyonectria robusta]KAH8650704.1 beta-lactamase family protein [Ilyonectria robusta]
MSNFEKLIESAVRDRVVPGVTLLAKDASGNFNYAKVTGKRSLGPGHEETLTQDTLFSLASMTKLLTTIAALQLVERGSIQLDDEVTPFVPVLARQEILTGFAQDGSPITKERSNPITLRQLLTHSAGAAYAFTSPLIQQWLQYTGRAEFSSTIDEAFDFPLVYESGEGWLYSSSLDWAGKVIEKVTGLTLEDYMQRNIFDPLGIKGITFWPRKNPELAPRLASISVRDSATGKTVYKEGTRNFSDGLGECFGGQGAFADLRDYLKVLHSILVDDEKLLKKQTTALIFQPQLSLASKAALKIAMKDPSWVVGHFPDTGEYDWGLGGLLIDGDKHDYRRRNTLVWSGAANLFWFIDRTAGLCGIFGTQVFPHADPTVEPLIKAFEEEVYTKAGMQQTL